MKDWDTCRNFEVIRGPILTRVRRWGFPRSPIHPLIAPSRMHLDVTYSFWAGMPRFFKESSMEAIVDFRIEAMRDDEWVFSGYSFDKALWIDAQGRLHDGPVPAAHQQNLWGVGFANSTSGDTFVALWLDHAVSGRDAIDHGGVPRFTTMDTVSSGRATQRNRPISSAAHALPSATPTCSPHGTTRHNVASRPNAIARCMRSSSTSKSTRSPNKSLAGRRDLRASVRPPKPPAPRVRSCAALSQVETTNSIAPSASILDLGYVYDVRVRGGVAEVVVTMPHRGRPVHEFLVSQGGGRVGEGIREHVGRVPGVDMVRVTPSWNPSLVARPRQPARPPGHRVVAGRAISLPQVFNRRSRRSLLGLLIAPTGSG